jgi:hypothetical protein
LYDLVAVLWRNLYTIDQGLDFGVKYENLDVNLGVFSRDVLCDLLECLLDIMHLVLSVSNISEFGHRSGAVNIEKNENGTLCHLGLLKVDGKEPETLVDHKTRDIDIPDNIGIMELYGTICDDS